MKRTVILAVGLCLLGTSCKKKVVATGGGATQIAAPAPPPAPQPQQAQTAPTAAPQPQTAAQPPASAPKKLTPEQRASLNELLARMADAFFDFDKYTIRTDAMATLMSNAEVIRSILAEYPTEKLLIEGHADERGSSEYNLALADRRSRAAQEFLASRGIPLSQLSVLSYGEERPACTEQTEACWQQNRRVHITVAP
jgi:peptidoglycan-associated lipoprotein